ncbi:MAG TPA: inositol monophosphatase family protein [Chlamydiales bacterium]|nr:inositol monophosphatase family protein [Chlamydiales bacterium]
MDQHKEKIFSNYTLIAIDAALQAGEILRQGYGTSFSITQKEGRHNLVTEYDHLAEKSILSFISKYVPNSHFLAEESGSTGIATDMLWIIDPLDGTVNFAHQIPVFSVSIALERKDELFCGVIYQPITHELFVAEKNKGAYLNGKALQVTKTSQLSDAILSVGFPYNLHENPHHCIEHFVDILRLGIPIRRLGSAAIDIAYTAAGRFDGFFEVGLSPWDCAAGILLIEEAGGKVSSWDNKPIHHRQKEPIICTNGKIHEKLSNVLMQNE